MAEINTGGGGGKGGKTRSKKMSTRIDLTPMVDLGFLLITFFMLTTTLSKPQALPIVMPDKEDKPIDSTKVDDDLALTIILSDKNKIYYYSGLGDNPDVKQTDFDPNEGIRKVLREKNAKHIADIEKQRTRLRSKEINADEYKQEVSKIRSAKDAMFVFVKADEDATYANLIDILDELLINQVGKYAIVDIDPIELDMINGTNNAVPPVETAP
jgi:biopolymer transport protein ExbD